MIPDLGLDSDERIVVKQKPHWIMFQASLTPAWLAIFVYLMAWLTDGLSVSFYALALYHWFGLIFLTLALVLGLCQYITYQKTHYIITTKRILVLSGLIHHQFDSIERKGIESTRVDRTLLGRWLGYGNIQIRCLGNSQQHISFVPNPTAFQEAMYH